MFICGIFVFPSKQVAPLAISDASMLAPEEVYKSAGLVKGESELTPEERKRRRAQKKRKRKGPIYHFLSFLICSSRYRPSFLKGRLHWHCFVNHLYAMCM